MLFEIFCMAPGAVMFGFGYDHEEKTLEIFLLLIVVSIKWGNEQILPL